MPYAELVGEAVKVGNEIARFSRPAVAMAKEAVNRAFETSLREGILFERRTFYSTFALDDQKEGMSAFAEKREPNFTNR
jgi:enoyl-CoA hydratase